MESHFPPTGNDDGGGSYPPIVPLEPWQGANVDQGDMEWEQDDENRYDYSQVDVGAPSQVLFTPRADDSSMDSFSRGLLTPFVSTQAHDIGDNIRGRVNLGDFVIPNGAGFQGTTTDWGVR